MKSRKCQYNDKRWYYRNVYLKSDHWKALKLAKLTVNPICQECGSEKNLDVHHLAYKELYNVLLWDLKILCRPCHTKKHPVVYKKRRGLKIRQRRLTPFNNNIERMRVLDKKQEKRRKRGRSFFGRYVPGALASAPIGRNYGGYVFNTKN